MGDVLDEKFHSRPAGEKSKTPITSYEGLDSLKQYFRDVLFKYRDVFVKN